MKMRTPTTPVVAVCLVGQPRSIALTAEGIRINILDNLNADAFVLASYAAEDGTDSHRLRELLGPRAIMVNVSSWNKTQGNAWWNQHVGPWGGHTHGHPHEQWSVRAECVNSISQIEEHRGARYSVYMRMRLDALPFRPIPLRYLQQLGVRRCSALIPAGEDYGGVNDRLLAADRCAFWADASILRWVSTSTIRERALRDKWILEQAHAAHLAHRNITLHRPVLPSCLIELDGSCKRKGELVLGMHEMPDLLDTRPQLCGLFLVSQDGPCDTTRKLWGGNWADDTWMQTIDPGFCKLERACAAASQARPALCLPDGSVVERGEILSVTAACAWGGRRWWAPGVEEPCARATQLVAQLDRRYAPNSSAAHRTPLSDINLHVVRGSHPRCTQCQNGTCGCGEDVLWTMPLCPRPKPARRGILCNTVFVVAWCSMVLRPRAFQLDRSYTLGGR